MKFNPKTILGFVLAGISGICAFVSSISDQKQQNRIYNMEKRINALENNK